MNTRETLRDLIRIDTQNPPGNERAAADYIAGLCREIGLDYELRSVGENRANLIVRLAPEREDRLVILGHLDVVPADASAWEHDPFAAEVVDGYVYGRGALDMKYFVAVALAVLAELKPQENRLTRGITCVFTADEEKGSSHGLPLVLEDETVRRELSGRTVLNEGGGFAYEYNGRRYYLVETGQKSVARVRVTVPELPDTNPYFPTLDHEEVLNRAIRALQAVDLRRPVPDTTRRLLDRFAGEGRNVDDQLAALAEFDDAFMYKLLYAMSHTMITPTMISGGSRHPDLPPSQKAAVTFDCRVLPGIGEEEFTTALRKALGHLPVDLEIRSFSQGYETAFSNPLVRRAEAALRHRDPSVQACLPFITPGANDGRYLRPLHCDVLGFAPLAASQPFGEVISRIHANNERIALESLEFCEQVMLEVCHGYVMGEPMPTDWMGDE
jgi:acetylornithine deacetylase/succinyl-diaminopimelate desuccinylase-like protein